LKNTCQFIFYNTIKYQKNNLIFKNLLSMKTIFFFKKNNFLCKQACPMYICWWAYNYLYWRTNFKTYRFPGQNHKKVQLLANFSILIPPSCFYNTLYLQHKNNYQIYLYLLILILTSFFIISIINTDSRYFSEPPRSDFNFKGIWHSFYFYI
jgi:hypothetical protein